MAENTRTSAGKRYVVNIKASLLCTCSKMCKMNVGAVSAASQYPKVVSIRPTEASGGVERSRSNEQRRNSTSRQRAVVRDVLTEKQRTRKTHAECRRDRKDQGTGSKTFQVDHLSCVANFGCENSRQCKKRL